MHKFLSRINHLNVRVSALFLLFGVLAILNFVIISYESGRIQLLEEQERELLWLESLPARFVQEKTLGGSGTLLRSSVPEITGELKHFGKGLQKKDDKKLLQSLQVLQALANNPELAALSLEWQGKYDAYQGRLKKRQQQLAQEKEREERRFSYVLLFLMLANLVGLSVGYSLFRVVVIRPLAHIGRVSEQISAGEEAEKLPYRQQDEIGAIAKAMNSLMDSLQHARDFVVHIGQGRLDAVYEGIEVEKEKNSRSLAGVLLGMQQHLQQIKQEEKQRQWAADGLGQFSELIRTQQESLEKLGDALVKELSAFMNVNQAAFYVLEGEENNISCTLKACYAFNRKKYLHQQILPGEGLVGQAWLEADMIYLTDVPADYARIKSGLGGASPKAVLIMPLMYNEVVQGMLELASFQLFAEHEIAFVKRLAESLGSSLMAIRTNEATHRLLEESQLMTEQLRAQEEEMRQNMEEMQATQEEINRSIRQEQKIEKELAARIAALDAAALMSETDSYGNITYVNERFCQVAKYRPEELLGRAHSTIRHPDNPKSLFREMWETIKAGKIFKGRYPNRAKDGSTYWVDATIVPVLDETGKPMKYIGVRFDITEQVQREQEFKALLQELEPKPEQGTVRVAG